MEGTQHPARGLSLGRAARVALLTGFGTGFAPFSPGTFGTLPGVALGLVLALGCESAAAPGVALALAAGALAALLFAFGCAEGRLMQERFRTDDPAEVVVDEIVGYLVALALHAAVLGPPDPSGVIALFVLFRFFDILKPPPVARLELLPGALGVMADDAAAGVYAGLASLPVSAWLLGG